VGRAHRSLAYRAGSCVHARVQPRVGVRTHTRAHGTHAPSQCPLPHARTHACVRRPDGSRYACVGARPCSLCARALSGGFATSTWLSENLGGMISKTFVPGNAVKARAAAQGSAAAMRPACVSRSAR
jgi:hypothetical protein